MSDIAINPQANINGNWAVKLINEAGKFSPKPGERELAEILINLAYNQAATPIGVSLAAAFDLFIASNYYQKLTNQGWLYCGFGEPLLLYPYTNICPRCILAGNFEYHPANKPLSGQIGNITRSLLCVFLDTLFRRKGLNLQIYLGSEPVDVIIRDEQNKVLLLAEVKASPLITLAIAAKTEVQTTLTDTDSITPLNHLPTLHLSLRTSDSYIFLPKLEETTWSYNLVSLGILNNEPYQVYRQLAHSLEQNQKIFNEYLDFWLQAYRSYQSRRNNSAIDRSYWLTNGCGQPYPKPQNWPKVKKGDSYESVSDSKTSVGLDRTDDIKKGIYQVLKLGAESKPYIDNYDVKVALLSNIHPVRHYDEYLSSLQDIVWTVDKTKQAKNISHLPPETVLYNLFDGIIAFTEIYNRDEWIRKTFEF